MTKAQLATAVLKKLAVIAAGEDADPDDQNLVEGVIDSVYPQLRKLGLAPFAVSSIDAWAERPMITIIAGEVGPEFGHRNTASNEAMKKLGRRELARQMTANRRGIPTKADYC